jgi:hypothetical protein
MCGPAGIRQHPTDHGLVRRSLAPANRAVVQRLEQWASSHGHARHEARQIF